MRLLARRSEQPFSYRRISHPRDGSSWHGRPGHDHPGRSQSV